MGKFLLKDVLEIGLRSESTPLGNLAKRRVGGGKQLLGKRKTQGKQIRARALSHRLRKEAVKVNRAEVDVRGKRFQGAFFVKMMLRVGNRLPYGTRACALGYLGGGSVRAPLRDQIGKEGEQLAVKG